ncbi:SMI1/KNR4 family protein [Flammeovirga sp. EKP202]|uniref:SMI1/KNR4 family protein n=1 Tax=Flammeovirga sp. EKP202 TaxID=2770592 RepID=UPI00165FF4CF|nr:SMI1/KNR4 family protein [Flammeovirga sp. EKP202]MBD0405175.1 SMI1/KNR4 family protein [Flammeovirga sp. EKP202]
MKERAYKDFYVDLKSFLIERNIEQENNIAGCSDSEIEELEMKIGSLPIAYKEYLLAMGRKNLARLFDCDNYSIGYLDYAKEVADEILNEDKFTIEKPYLVLSEHHGYNFTYISMNHENPPVYFYMETEKSSTLVSNKFTSWIKETAINSIELKPWNDEVCREISENRNDWMERKKILDSYDEQANNIRTSFIKDIEKHEDEQGDILPITDLQTNWINHFEQTDLAKILKKEKRRIPWGWVDLKYQSITTDEENGHNNDSNVMADEYGNTKTDNESGFWNKLKSWWS